MTGALVQDANPLACPLATAALRWLGKGKKGLADLLCSLAIYFAFTASSDVSRGRRIGSSDKWLCQVLGHRCAEGEFQSLALAVAIWCVEAVSLGLIIPFETAEGVVLGGLLTLTVVPWRHRSHSVGIATETD